MFLPHHSIACLRALQMLEILLAVAATHLMNFVVGGHWV
jgi:hypothetical protein